MYRKITNSNDAIIQVAEIAARKLTLRHVRNYHGNWLSVNLTNQEKSGKPHTKEDILAHDPLATSTRDHPNYKGRNKKTSDNYRH